MVIFVVLLLLGNNKTVNILMKIQTVKKSCTISFSKYLAELMKRNWQFTYNKNKIGFENLKLLFK
jgi:hypothetical protein